MSALPPIADMCFAMSACPLCHKRTLREFSPIKGNPWDIARCCLGGKIICQNDQNSVQTMSVRSRVIAWTTYKYVGATTVAVGLVIGLRTIKKAVISRTIIVRPLGSDSCSESKTSNDGTGNPPATTTPARFGLVGQCNRGNEDLESVCCSCRTSFPSAVTLKEMFEDLNW